MYKNIHNFEIAFDLNGLSYIKSLFLEFSVVFNTRVFS